MFSLEHIKSNIQGKLSKSILQEAISGRNHYTIDKTIGKLREDNPDLSLEDALSAAIYAHNLQINKTGYSPR